MAVIPDCVEDGILLERPGGIGADSVQNSTPPPPGRRGTIGYCRAVSGLIVFLTSLTLLAGNPLRFACSSIRPRLSVS